MLGQIFIRRISDYWEVIKDGLAKGKKKEDIRNELVNSFRGEMYGLLMMHLNVDNLNDVPETEENERKAETVMREILRKWRKLCDICRKYKETADIIHPDDLTWDDETTNN